MSLRRILRRKRFNTLSTVESANEKVEHHPFDDEASSSVYMGFYRNASTAAFTASAAPLPPSLKVERLDYYYSCWSSSWKYKKMGEKVTPEKAPVDTPPENDQWSAFCFVVIRKLPRKGEGEEPTFQISIESPYLIRACEDVIQKQPGLSWNAWPLRLTPRLLIAFLPKFEQYHADLAGKKDKTQDELYKMNTVSILIDYLHKDFKTTIATIRRFISLGEITYDMLYAIMVPGTLLVTTCPTTGEPRALHLVSVTMIGATYELLCESVDAVDDTVETDGWGSTPNVTAGLPRKAVGRVESRVIIPWFDGQVKINELDTYPIQFHANEAQLRKTLLARGRKWVSLKGIHHVQYNGIASICTSGRGANKQHVKYNVDSRIMIDRANFRRLKSCYDMPRVKEEMQDQSSVDFQPDPWQAEHSPQPQRNIPTLRAQTNSFMPPVAQEISDEDLILSTPILYGFSLSDKIWLEFNVAAVSEIQWNDEAFQNLVLPEGRKTLLKSLVEAHNANPGFDDFVKGKGHGLIINLFGPPGVGKTLSAEATSEHVQSPLYVIGGSDLGTSAMELDDTLQRLFDVATSWKAIVLIDEADVFLQQRSMQDLQRNAMVSAFLRHVEYYRGILFLTTNHVKAFDGAFLSRIHISLHFKGLSKDAKAQVWRAFLAKVGVKVGAPASGVTEDELQLLAERDIDGRQIKNATRTANSLAVSRSEGLAYAHLEETLEAMLEFAAEFESVHA